MAAAMAVWVPMASMVTVQPVSAKVESSSGMAVISLDFSADGAVESRTGTILALSGANRFGKPQYRLIWNSSTLTTGCYAGSDHDFTSCLDYAARCA